MDADITEAVGAPAARGGRRGPYAALRDRLTAPTRFEGVFPPALRRLGVIWVCVTVPLITVASTFVHDQASYIFVFVFLASGCFTTPALVVAWPSVRWAPEQDRGAFRLWYLALGLTYLTGVAMLAGLVDPSATANALGLPLVAVIAALFTVGVVRLVRNRSGHRALSIDVIEAAMSLVAVVSPCVLVWGDSVLGADAAWFAVPAALATIALVSGAYWTLVLLVRMGPGAGPREICHVTLTVLGVADAGAQVAQGVSGFTLPAPPLIALHATCMAMLLLIPLHQPRTVLRGLDRLPPQAQVRGGGLAALLTLAGLPVLLVATAWQADRKPWATSYSLGVVTLLLVLAALRHLATVRETRRLYARVERASDERRELLARMMQRADDDRHRVAAQLHEQAVSAYASFVSFIQACGAPGPTASSSPLAGASAVVRDDLARHADSLRHLMLAIQPLESGRTGSETLAAPIQAYVYSLYDDRRAPRLTVDIADGLVLDWITETIVLRIVQEAVRNVWRHSGAAAVDVSIGMGARGVEVRVTDDGVGFDPAASLFESGIAAMRSFAAVMEGDLRVDSAPGAGTTVMARLGAVGNGQARRNPNPSLPADDGDELDVDDDLPDDIEPGQAEPRPLLRLVQGRGVSR
jgi:signal transduction histidine kinase